MNRLRKVFGLMIALTLGLFAAASNAADKQYTLTMAVSANPTTVTATFVNKGNSSYNSLSITAPAGIEILSATIDRSGTPALVSTGPGNTLNVNAINLPGGSGQTQVLTMTVNAPCGSYTGTWSAQPWTGTPVGSGTKFAMVSPSTTSTTTTKACQLYSYTLPLSAITRGTPASSVTATVTNNPISSAPITEIKLNAPNGLLLNVPALSGWTIAGNGTGSVTLNTGSLAAGATLNVPTNVSALCGATTGTAAWDVKATGFSLPAAFTAPTVAISGSCGLAVEDSPASAASGTPFTVKVKALDGSGVQIPNLACGDVSFSIASQPGSGATLTPGTCTDTGGVVERTLTITGTTGNYALSASSTFGGANLSVSIPGFSVYQGQLNCNQALDPNLLNPSALPDLDPATGLPVPGWAGNGKRGIANKAGDPCIKVDYNFTNNILTDNSVRLVWATNVQPGAAFKYSVNWQAEYVDPATGLPKAKSTKYQWGSNPVVVGKACLSSSLPTPYGNLAAPVAAADSFVKFTPGTGVTLPPAPFPIMIDGEWMLVTGAATADGYPVTRLTSARADHGTTYTGGGTKQVMSTPLPLDGPIDGATTKPMLMCSADEGFVVVPAGTTGCPVTGIGAPTNPPLACGVVTTTVIDIGDGGALRDY